MQRVSSSQTGQTSFPSLANPVDEQTSRSQIQRWTSKVSPLTRFTELFGNIWRTRLMAEMLRFFAFAGKFSSCGFYDTGGM